MTNYYDLHYVVGTAIFGKRCKDLTDLMKELSRKIADFNNSSSADEIYVIYQGQKIFECKNQSQAQKATYIQYANFDGEKIMSLVKSSMDVVLRNWEQMFSATPLIGVSVYDKRTGALVATKARYQD